MNPLPALELIFFLQWLARTHPEISDLSTVPRDRLMELVVDYRPDLRQRPRQQGIWASSVRLAARPTPGVRGYDAAHELMLELWASPVPATPPRYRNVPLHAVPLYSSEDEAFASYLLDHWDALDRLSGSRCDLHPSVKQLRGREDVYVILDSDLETGEAIRLPDLPGLLFWNRAGSSRYVTFRRRDPEQIKEAFRTLFAAIRVSPTIQAVRTAQTELGEAVSRDSHGPVFHQHVYGGTAAQGMHVTQNVAFADLGTQLRGLAPTVRDDVREQFLADIEILEDDEEESQKRISAGKRIRHALTDGGTKVVAATIIAGIEQLIRIISS